MACVGSLFCRIVMPLLRSRAGRVEPVVLTVQVDRPRQAPVYAEPVLKLQPQPMNHPRPRASVSFADTGGNGGALRSARRVTRQASRSPYAKIGEVASAWLERNQQPTAHPDPPNPYADSLASSMAEMLMLDGPISARTRLRRRQFAMRDPAAPLQRLDPATAQSGGATLARASVTLSRLPHPPTVSMPGGSHSGSGSSVPMHKSSIPVRPRPHRKLAPLAAPVVAPMVSPPPAVDATRVCRPPREAMAEERKRRGAVATAAATTRLCARQPLARQTSLASYTAPSGRAVSMAH